MTAAADLPLAELLWLVAPVLTPYIPAIESVTLGIPDRRQRNRAGGLVPALFAGKP